MRTEREWKKETVRLLDEKWRNGYEKACEGTTRQVQIV